jgi:hypothetical protein
MYNTKLARSLATVALVATILFVAPYAHAQTTGDTQQHGGFFQGFIQFLEQKFGLDKSQVQSAAQEYKAQITVTPRPTLTADQVTDKEKGRLDKLVSNGKITAAQEQAILTELATLRSKYPTSSLQNMTPDQRRTQLQAMQNELKTWAQSQNIDPTYLMPFGMSGMGMGKFEDRGQMRGGMKGHGMWGKPSGAPTPAPTS